MNAVWETMAPFVTPLSVKTVLYGIALILMCVGFGRHRRVGTVPLAVALCGSLSLSLLAGLAPGRTPTGEQWWLWGVTGAAALGALLMRWWRPVAWIEAVVLSLRLGFAVYREGPGLPAVWTAADSGERIRLLCRAVWALTWLLAVVYSVSLALRRPEGRAGDRSVRLTPPALSEPPKAPAWAEDPLPPDVTLRELLPEMPAKKNAVPEVSPAAGRPAGETVTVSAGSETAAASKTQRLPEGLKQTGVGAQLLLCKRRLDAGEISPADYERQKAELLGLSDPSSGDSGGML